MTDSADKFLIAKALLVTYRNRDIGKCTRLAKSFPELKLDLESYPEQGEDFIFKVLEETYNEKLKRDIAYHKDNLLKKEKGIKNNSDATMNRLRPPGAKKKSGVECIWDPESAQVVEDPDKVIGCINKHWEKTFERKFSPHKASMKK